MDFGRLFSWGWGDTCDGMAVRVVHIVEVVLDEAVGIADFTTWENLRNTFAGVPVGWRKKSAHAAKGPQ